MRSDGLTSVPPRPRSPPKPRERMTSESQVRPEAHPDFADPPGSPSHIRKREEGSGERDKRKREEPCWLFASLTSIRPGRPAFARCRVAAFRPLPAWASTRAQAAEPPDAAPQT